MKSFNNIEIEVGMDVIVLQTPIIRGHKFINGKVVALTKKVVQVECPSIVDWYGGAKLFKRKPKQVIVVV